MVHDRFTVDVGDVDTLKAAVNASATWSRPRRLPRDAGLLTPAGPGCGRGTWYPGDPWNGLIRGPDGGHPGGLRRHRPHRHRDPAGLRHPPPGGAPGAHRRCRRGRAAAADRRPPGSPRYLLLEQVAGHPAPGPDGGEIGVTALVLNAAGAGVCNCSSATTAAPPADSSPPAAAQQAGQKAPAAPPWTRRRCRRTSCRSTRAPTRWRSSTRAASTGWRATSSPRRSRTRATRSRWSRTRPTATATGRSRL